MVREIVRIDESKCDGCGLCIPACPEGALRIVDGKARLVAERLCDGMGACLGHCPRGAIIIERREAEEFDEAAVRAAASMSRSIAACPGASYAEFSARPRPDLAEEAVPTPPGQLTHWPVQLHLLSPLAPVLRGARLLVCADCVPFAYAGFHGDLLRGRAVVVACPKLDDTTGYVRKLAQMIAQNDLAEITVAHMEVPCCTGILHLVLEALARAGTSTPVNEVVVSIRGQVLARRSVPVAIADR
jgi:Pyruvate/2-oxoacid:ferredoxin oxidoreductase delta subunit